MKLKILALPTLLILCSLLGVLLLVLTYFKAISPLKVSDEIQIWVVLAQFFSVIVLGWLALFQENIKRWWFYPELNIDFEFAPPDCHKTELRDEGMNNVADAYYFRFGVANTGKTHAQLCEAVIETFSTWNVEKGKFESVERWNPVNLAWSMRASKDEFRTINPGRKVYCDLGCIDERGRHLFVLCLYLTPFNQNHFFPKWKYKFGVSVYCENSRGRKIARKEFIVDWYGKWFDDESKMFSEGIKIEAL